MEPSTHVPVAVIYGLVAAFLSILGLVCGFIIAVFRRQGSIRDSMNLQVGTIQDKIDSTKTEILTDVKEVDRAVDSYKESWDARREGIIAVMVAHCADHRGLCTTGMIERIDHVEKRCMNGVQSVGLKSETACKKIEEIKRQRERRWDKQEAINAKILSGEVGGPIQGGPGA